MDSIEDLIYAAWYRVADHLDQHPDELARRLARRSRPMLTRPPRAWCLAVRASDHRIPVGFDDPVEHQVTLDADLLRRICAPVYLDPPGQTLDEVACKLGTSAEGLVNARIKGIFDVHHIKGLAGRRGKPVPLLYHRGPLDACAPDFSVADPVWSSTVECLIRRIPSDLQQTLTRVPYFRPHTSKHAYDDDRHPELDVAPRRSRLRRLPPPQPDPVWYKWSKSGHFLGDDRSNWRKHPSDLGERPAKWRVRRKGNYKPRLSQSAGSLHFNGFHWLCPACGRTCRTIYYPLPRINFLIGEQPLVADEVWIPRGLDAFACFRCHNLRRFSRADRSSWNNLIAYLTAGLLYGREVQRPSWFTLDRKRGYSPRTSRSPSRRREQILDLLLRGLSYDAIAGALGVGYGTVHGHVKKLYHQYAVHSRKALARKLNRQLPQPQSLKRQAVRQAMGKGLTRKEIATRTGLTLAAVHHHIRAIRRDQRRRDSADVSAGEALAGATVPAGRQQRLH